MSKKKTDVPVSAAAAEAPKATSTVKTTSTAKPKATPEKAAAKAATKKAPAKKAAIPPSAVVDVPPAPLTPTKKAFKAPKPEPVVDVPIPVASSAPSYEEIAQLAYSYAEARSFVGGSSDEDWFRAEAELRRIRGL